MERLEIGREKAREVERGHVRRVLGDGSGDGERELGGRRLVDG